MVIDPVGPSVIDEFKTERKAEELAIAASRLLEPDRSIHVELWIDWNDRTFTALRTMTLSPTSVTYYLPPVESPDAGDTTHPVRRK